MGQNKRKHIKHSFRGAGPKVGAITDASPPNTRPEPSEGKKKAGYRKLGWRDKLGKLAKKRTSYTSER